MPLARLLPFIFFLIITSQSCKNFHSKDLTKLPVTNNENSLDSLQSDILFQYARYFPNGTEISLCFINGNKEKYIGIKRQNDSLFYIDNSNRIFAIASITKSFTGIMLSKLVYEGKVNPEAPVRNILPIQLKQSSKNGVEITLTHLANHTSGLPFGVDDIKNTDSDYDRYNPSKNYGIHKLNNYLSNKMVLYSVPGEKRTYSNLGVGLLGHILSIITGKTYEQLLKESICNPLGMQHTFITFDDEKRSLLVLGRDEKGLPLKSDDNDTTAFVGAGGIKSTARDLAKYIHANIYDTTYFLLAQKTTKVLDKHFTASIAWAPYNDSGLSHIGAFGATGGYTSGIIFERNKHIGIVVITNVSTYIASRGNYSENLCKALYDYLIKHNK